MSQLTSLPHDTTRTQFLSCDVPGMNQPTSLPHDTTRTQPLSCDVPGMSHHHLPGNTSSCETRLAKDYQELAKIKASMRIKLDKTKDTQDS